MTKKFPELLTLVISQDMKADLELRSLQEEVSMAQIVRRAIRKELADTPTVGMSGKQHPQLSN